MKTLSVFILIILAAVALGAYYLWQTFIPEAGKTEISEPIVFPEKEAYYDKLKSVLQSGGPGKDGIPAIDNPQYESVNEANKWLLPNDVVFGMVLRQAQDGDFVAAYPQRILVWHEIANETIDGKQIVISYCPLTGTAIGYKGRDSAFGVSGKLINSNLVMYDRKTNSYWPQMLGQAITGPAKGNALQEFPIVWTTWEKWKAKYPSTKVLSRKTGFLRDYSVEGDPYGSYVASNKGYYESDPVIFELTNEDKRLPPKTVVVGLRDSENNAVAILKDYLRQNKKVEVKLGERMVVVNYDTDLDFYTVDPVDVNAYDAMWFAWAAFYPKTELIK